MSSRSKVKWHRKNTEMLFAAVGRKWAEFIGVLAKHNSSFCHLPFLMQNIFMFSFKTEIF